MLVTRPFLLCQLLRGDRIASSRKRQRFNQLARTCISAAEASLGIFEDMAQHKVASSLVMMDFFFALQVVQVILVAAALYCRQTYRKKAIRCIDILHAIATTGYPRHLLPETLFELRQVGLTKDPPNENISSGGDNGNPGSSIDEKAQEYVIQSARSEARLQSANK